MCDSVVTGWSESQREATDLWPLHYRLHWWALGILALLGTSWSGNLGWWWEGGAQVVSLSGLLLTARNMCPHGCWCHLDFEWMRYCVQAKYEMNTANYRIESLLWLSLQQQMPRYYTIANFSKTSHYLICGPFLWNGRFCRPLSFKTSRPAYGAASFTST